MFPPEQVFQAIGRLRKDARDEIDRLLQFLDETDNHMEREPDGDEADASYPESGSRVCNPMEDDEEDDANEDADPAEPSLGSLDGRTDQNLWAMGNSKDLEEEHEGAEDDQEGDDNPEDERALRL